MTETSPKIFAICLFIEKANSVIETQAEKPRGIWERHLGRRPRRGGGRGRGLPRRSPAAVPRDAGPPGSAGTGSRLPLPAVQKLTSGGPAWKGGGPAWKGGLQPRRGWPRSARPHTTGSSRRGLRKDERCSLTPSADHREGFRARVGNAVTSPRSSQPPTAGASSLPLWGGQPRDSARSASRSVTFEAALRGRGCRSAHAQTPPQPRSPRRLWGSPRRGGVRPSWSPRLEGSQGGRTRIVCLLNILS